MRIAVICTVALAAAAAPAAELTLGPKTLSYGVGVRVGGGYVDTTPAQGVSVNTLLSRKHYAVLHLRDRLKKSPPPCHG